MRYDPYMGSLGVKRLTKTSQVTRVSPKHARENQVSTNHAQEFRISRVQLHSNFRPVPLFSPPQTILVCPVNGSVPFIAGLCTDFQIKVGAIFLLLHTSLYIFLS